ncbi:hypothetical protein EDF75_0762 [Raoultella sp. BIGb0149]|uniref:hypothetical protein n=1 Tax=Raoultella sp. BIGb0149 TaxID=2485116 RepID=UPI001060AE00|nr:hypothetical protein [Raoultella sp. BIGb0149]TDQ26711.1 hypothetical protein EDF75_0762 [Raoultella sp. BIGb0149]
MSTEYRKINTAVCLGDLKQAAIYFEKVVPINSIELIDYIDIPISESYPIQNYIKDRENLLLDSLYKNSDTIMDLIFGRSDDCIVKNAKARIIEDLCRTTRMLQFKVVNKYPQLFYNPSYVMDRMHEVQQHLIANEIISNNNIRELNCTPEKIINSFCKSLNIDKFSLTLPSGVDLDKDNKQTNDVQVSLVNVNLIDTTNTSWEQIIELRKDTQLCSSLRRLKLMMHDSYTGKSLDYIYDDMQRKIEQYELACKAMGLKTISSHISHIKNFTTEHGVSLSLIAGILGSQGFDLSNGLSIGAISAAAVSLLQYGIEIKSNNNEIRKLKNENPIAFIIDVNKKLN